MSATIKSGRPVLPLTGGCPCGAVRYAISAFPLFLYACHCTDCQRQSGSAFALNMPVATEAFRVVAGTPTGWRRLAPSGATVVSWFCGDCGGRINGERIGRPELTVVRAGTLDDTSWLSPGAHFYTRSAHAGSDRRKMPHVSRPWRLISGRWSKSGRLPGGIEAGSPASHAAHRARGPERWTGSIRRV